MVSGNKLPRRGQFDTEIVFIEPLGTEHIQVQLALSGLNANVMAKAKPGQFIQVACRNIDNPREQMPLLRRPFGISSLKTTDNRTVIDIICQILGLGTKWLSQRHPGDVVNIIGPLGNGFSIPANPDGRFILIGGGVGLPPLFFLADRLHQQGHKNVIAVAGAQNASRITGELTPNNSNTENPLKPGLFMKQFNTSDTPVIIATDDNSFGFGGNAVMALAAFLEKNNDWKNATVYACGPKPMLKALAEFTINNNMPCQLSLEEYMSCGIGLCQSCAVELHHHPAPNEQNEPDEENGQTESIYKLICTNGPVFDARKIVW